MEDIQRKTEKILGSKNYKNYRDRELRGESPNRKGTNGSKTATRLQSRSSLIPPTSQPQSTLPGSSSGGGGTSNGLYSTQSFQNAHSYSKYRANYQPSTVCVHKTRNMKIHLSFCVFIFESHCVYRYIH
jgi:hypothetical protein